MPSLFFLVCADIDTLVFHREQAAPDAALHVHNHRIDGDADTGINRIRHANLAILHAAHSFFQTLYFLFGPLDFSL